MENLDTPPHPLQIKDGKIARFRPSRSFILDLGGGGWWFAVPFYFVQDCSTFLSVFVTFYINQVVPVVLLS